MNPQDEYYQDYFTKAWIDQMRDTIFPRHSKATDVYLSLKVLIHLIHGSIKKLFNRTQPLDLDRYMAYRCKI